MELALLALVGAAGEDLYEAWDTADPGQGYEAKAAEWRARLPAKEEEQADDTGPPT